MMRFQRRALLAAVLLLAPVVGARGQEADEVPVIDTLRAIWKAQEEFAAAAHVDTGGDGIGEYGTLQELAGALPLRTAADGAAEGSEPLDAGLIPRALGAVDADGRANAHGYLFRLHLPSTDGETVHESKGRAVAEGRIDPVLASSCWACYAWPREGATGKTFFVNQVGDVLSTEAGLYAGPSAEPLADAAFVTLPKTILLYTAIDSVGGDGHRWERTPAEGLQERSSRELERLEGRRRRWQYVVEQHAAGGLDTGAVLRMLQAIEFAQALFQMSGSVDVDSDGAGEFGVFQELTGARPVRTAADGSGGEQVWQSLQEFEDEFDKVSSDGDVVHAGYRFRIWLPGRDGIGVHEVPGRAVAEGSTIDTDLAETTWCCYAWPAERGGGVQWVYCVNQTRDIVGTHTAEYAGPGGSPEAGAAFTKRGRYAIHGPLAADEHGHDGLQWSRVDMTGAPGPRGRMGIGLDERIRILGFERAGQIQSEFLRLEKDAGRAGESQRCAQRTAIIKMLRNLEDAQFQFHAVGKVDVDRDGEAEYGTFQELTGALAMRTATDGSTTGGSVLAPPILPGQFRASDESGIVVRSGYCFRMLLPGTGGLGLHQVEGRASPAGQPIDTDLAETTWCCYAWPESEQSGLDAFVVNQTGDIMATAAGDYVGPKNAPKAGAAFIGGGENHIHSQLADGAEGQDGRVWVNVE